MDTDESERHGVHIVTAGEGTVIKIAGMTITIKVSGAETGGACTIFEATIPPHFAEYGPYAHQQATAIYHVTAGTLAFTVAQETLMVRSGGFVMVPPGEQHKFWNPTATPATCLAYLCPAGFEQYVMALATLAEEEPFWPPVDRSKVAALNERYAMQTYP
jgi:mannose-6-phosphate isomerase-like protein (cupin superfamily)